MVPPSFSILSKNFVYHPVERRGFIVKKRLFGTICMLVALLVLCACAGSPSATPSPQAAWPGSTTLPSGYRLEVAQPETPVSPMGMNMYWLNCSPEEMAAETVLFVSGKAKSCHMYNVYRNPTSILPAERLCIVELEIMDVLYAQEGITCKAGDTIRFQVMAEAYDEYMVPYFTSDFLAPQITDGSLFFLKKTENALDEEGNIKGFPYTELSEYALFHNIEGVWKPIEDGYSLSWHWGQDMEQKLAQGKFGQAGTTTVTTDGAVPFYLKHITRQQIIDYFLSLKQ